jgi:hypothetical protein
MSSEAKFYPRSNESRYMALYMAHMINAATSLNNPLTQRTRDRLNLIFPEYKNKMAERAIKKAEAAGLVAEKEKLREKLSMYCSHFLQVFNMCVKRGEYKAAERSYYGMDVSSEKLPPLLLQNDVWTAAQQLIKGEQMRIAAGGTPMVCPSADEVEAVFNAFKPLAANCSNAKDAYDNAQEAVQKLNKEANGVIKKVWREVEIYYNEQPRPSMREHARRWGVEYARKGYKKKVTGVITDSETGLPLQGVKLKLATGRKKISSGIDGKFTLSTSLMEEQMLTATLAGYKPVETEITLYENRDTVCNIGMSKL